MNDRETLKFLPSQYVIDGYGRGGFRFADMSHQGNLLSTPSGMSAWNVSSTFSEPDFEKIFSESELIDMFFLGCGTDIMPISSSLRQLFKDHKIAFDTMPTAVAARTYNIVLAEGRRVACGLIAVT